MCICIYIYIYINYPRFYTVLSRAPDALTSITYWAMTHQRLAMFSCGFSRSNERNKSTQARAGLIDQTSSAV